MNHCMDIFWMSFDSLGGAQCCMSMVGSIWSYISNGLADVMALINAGCK